MAMPPLSLKARALKLLTAREHSRAELERKLTPHLQPGDDLDAVLDELTRRGFLDEARYVESVVHRRAARSGTRLIRQELQAQGIAPELMAGALDTLRDSELGRARNLWLRRYGSPPADAREAARQQRFLMSRGFSSEVVRQLVRWGGGRSSGADEPDESFGPGDDDASDPG